MATALTEINSRGDNNTLARAQPVRETRRFPILAGSPAISFGSGPPGQRPVCGACGRRLPHLLTALSPRPRQEPGEALGVREDQPGGANSRMSFPAATAGTGAGRREGSVTTGKEIGGQRKPGLSRPDTAVFSLSSGPPRRGGRWRRLGPWGGWALGTGMGWGKQRSLLLNKGSPLICGVATSHP